MALQHTLSQMFPQPPIVWFCVSGHIFFFLYVIPIPHGGANLIRLILLIKHVPLVFDF